jgi:hypothetical protein
VKVLLAWAALAALVYTPVTLAEFVLTALFNRLRGRWP